MAPHANSPLGQDRLFSICDPINPGMSVDVETNGIFSTHENQSINRSHLAPTLDDELHDLICIGFGPASLAIAIALHDGLETSSSTFHGTHPKVAFLEQQSNFAWHAGMLLDGATMQITFIKDMATLRNPRSSFTFLNYLHMKNRLLQFTNLDTFLPQRIEFEDYLQWCASWFQEVVHYGNEAVEIVPEKYGRGRHAVDSFLVKSRDVVTNELTVRRTKHVVVATGGKARIPPPFPTRHPRILHSSQYCHKVPSILSDRQAPYSIVIVGSGQSAAEIFNDLHSRYPNAKTRLIVRGTALKPSDDSPFVNEIFDPSRVSQFYAQSSSTRANINAENRTTNYGVVRLELLERIYQTLYMQRIRFNREENWPHQIMTNSDVIDVGVERPEKVFLKVAEVSAGTNEESESCVQTKEYEADMVVVATGYTRDAHEKLLIPARLMLPGGYEPGKKWTVTREYKVEFEHDLVSDDAGVYLQGCNEESHGLADSLLSILAVRGGEIVDSIFGKKKSISFHNGKMNAINGLASS